MAAHAILKKQVRLGEPLNNVGIVGGADCGQRMSSPWAAGIGCCGNEPLWHAAGQLHGVTLQMEPHSFLGPATVQPATLQAKCPGLSKSSRTQTHPVRCHATPWSSLLD